MSIFSAVNWSQGVQDAWTQVATFVPKFIAFLAILIIGFFIAKALCKAVDTILNRVGFNRAVERGGLKKALASSSLEPSDVLGKIVQYGVMLFVLQLGFGVFGPNAISDLLTSVVAYLPKIFASVVIMVIASSIAAAVREVVVASIGGLSYGKILANVAGGAILAVGGFAALSQLEIAQPIVTGLFYAVLGCLVGVTVIAVGGGGVRPMQGVWEKSLDRLQEESGNLKEQASGAGERIQERAEERVRQAHEAVVDVREQNESDDRDSIGASAPSEWPGTRYPQGF